MQCPFCAAEHDPITQGRFCDHCGLSVSAPPGGAEPKPPAQPIEAGRCSECGSPFVNDRCPSCGTRAPSEE